MLLKEHPLKIALIGTGSSANNIATSISMIDGLEIAALANHNAESAKLFAEKFSIPFVTENLEELCSLKDIDYVIISIPHALHKEAVLIALKHGKHVLCEKPIATKVEDAEEMIMVAKEKRLKLGAFFQNRFFEAIQTAKELIDSGQLGKILQANVSVMWYRDADYYSKSAWRGRWDLEGGGCLINQSIHTIDEIIYLLGDVETLFGFWDHKVHDIEVDDNTCAVFQFCSGVFGSFQTSTSSGANFPANITIYGSEKAIQIDGNILTILESDGSRSVLDYTKDEGGQVGSSSDPKKFSMKAQIALLTDFSKAIIEDREPMVSGEEGLKSLKVVRAVYESNGEKVIKIS